MALPKLPKKHWIRDQNMEAFLAKKVEEHREALQSILDRYNASQTRNGVVHPINKGTISEFQVFLNHRMFSAAGQAYYSHNMIEINYDLFKDDLNPETNDDLMQTLIHELCHLVCPADIHKGNWPQTMRVFGLKPERCHDLKVEKKRKWNRTAWDCPACEKTYELTDVKIRRLKRSVYINMPCCGQRVSPQTLP
jgi:predicted SprT family Zn-dependent metalloprotease